jgi:hypothetical protein
MLEKKVKIYSETRRNIVLTGDDSGDVGDTRKETDEVLGGLGLEKWGYAAVDDLTEEITRPRRQFSCWVVKDQKGWVLTEKRVAEAMFIKSTKEFASTTLTRATGLTTTSAATPSAGREEAGWLVSLLRHHCLGSPF